MSDPIVLPFEDATVHFYESFYSAEEAKTLFAQLREEVQWQQQTLKMFGKEIKVPRLVAWYGDGDKSYTYSGMTLQPHVWSPLLQQIKNKIEQTTQTSFNSVLLNLYRDETDSVGWHSDDEPELGDDPIIASLSLGAEREFQFKHYSTDERHKIILTSGSLLLMRKGSQVHYKHRIPKTKKPLSKRINLTFRTIY